MFVWEPVSDWRSDALASRQAGGLKSTVRAGSRCGQISCEKKYSDERMWLRKPSHGSERPREGEGAAAQKELIWNTVQAGSFEKAAAMSLTLWPFFFFFACRRVGRPARPENSPTHLHTIADNLPTGWTPWKISVCSSDFTLSWAEVIGWIPHFTPTNQTCFWQFKQVVAWNSQRLQLWAKQNWNKFPK